MHHPGFYYYYPYDPGPPPPPGPAELSARLLNAILKRDLKAARQVFDTAFWDKVNFTPDFYHLLQAVNAGDRAMVQLVTSYGATWTEAEAKAARLLLKEKIDPVEGVLKAVGIRTQFTPEELAAPDPLVLVRISSRGAYEARIREQKDAPEAEQRLQDVLRLALIDAVTKGDRALVDEVISHRHSTLGDGSAEKPLNIAGEFSQLLRGNPSHETALAFVDALKAMDVKLMPMIAGGAVATMRPEIIPALLERGLLSSASMDDRGAMLDHWVTLDDKETEKRGHLSRAANILFRPQTPATEKEAEHFVRLHLVRMQTAPARVAEAEQVLLKRGFFDSSAFTAKHFRDMMIMPPADASLAKAFNARAMARTITENGLAKFLNDKRFTDLAAAHEAGAWKANAQETLKIMKFLSGKVRKDIVPPEVVAQLKSLKKGGADFSLVAPHEYLGKRGPGFAKALLDTGAVTAKQFDLDAVGRKLGKTVTLLTPATSPDHANVNFACQLLLERIVPGEYEKMRGVPDADYQRAMVKAYVNNPVVRHYLGKSSQRPPIP
ncbi:MAG: hypothetical protein ACAH80_04120 [Alphaproteobacteria bacterium]